MLACGAQPVIEENVGRAPVRLGEGAGFEPHQRRGLLDPGGHDAARTVILEAARDDPDPVRQQRRGQRVPRMPLVFPSVEAEPEHPPALDHSSFGQAKMRCHPPTLPHILPGRNRRAIWVINHHIPRAGSVR